MQRSQSKSTTKDTVDPEREPKEGAPLRSNWLHQWMEECSWNSQGGASLKTVHADDARSDKILEVDTWKPHLISKQGDRIFRTSQHFNYLSKHSTKFQKQNLGVPSREVSSLRSLKFPAEVNQAAAWTSENSPRVHSASSRPGSSGRKGPFSPARSECSRSVFSSYLGYPNYMSNTESSLAKVRSHSAPRQRMQVEKLGSTSRFGHGFWDTDTISERGSVTFDANFGAKAYSGSGHLDQFGMPIQGSNSAGYSSSYHRRY